MAGIRYDFAYESTTAAGKKHDPFQADEQDAELIAAEVARRVAAKLFSSQPLGIGDDCLSPAEIVAITNNGLTGDHLEHCIECSVCFENVTGLAEMQLQSPPDFVANALVQAGRWTPAEIKKQVTEVRDRARPLLALVGLREPVIDVDTSHNGSIAFECEMIPTFTISADAPAIGGLLLTGALSAKKIEIKNIVDFKHNGNADMIKLQCPDATLSSRVRRGIINHQSVVDTILLEGHVGADKHPFTGQARVTFRPR